MNHGRFCSILVGLATAALLAITILMFRVSSTWIDAQPEKLAKAGNAAGIMAAVILLLPGIASCLACILRGKRLRVAMLGSIILVAFLATLFHDRIWPHAWPVAAALAIPALIRLPWVGRREGASAAVPALAAIVVALVAWASGYVFGAAVPAVLADMTNAAGEAYGVPVAEVIALDIRMKFAMQAAEAIAFLVAGTIWTIGAMMLASHHERMTEVIIPPTEDELRGRRCRPFGT